MILELRLKECLEERNARRKPGEPSLTQQDIARKIGVSESFISYLFSGQRRLSLELAVEIADTLGCQVQDLFASPDSRDVNHNHHAA